MKMIEETVTFMKITLQRNYTKFRVSTSCECLSYVSQSIIHHSNNWPFPALTKSLKRNKKIYSQSKLMPKELWPGKQLVGFLGVCLYRLLTYSKNRKSVAFGSLCQYIMDFCCNMMAPMNLKWWLSITIFCKFRGNPKSSNTNMP